VTARAWILATGLAAFGAIGPSGAQQYRDGYPEVLSPPAAQPVEQVRLDYPTLERVRQNYLASNQPAVLVLVGRTLGASTSEWQADHRDVTSNLQQSFQGGASSTTRQTGVRQTENRIPVAATITPALEEFQRGFERIFGHVGIRTLHYDTALRRAQQENELQGRLSREGDRRKNEADAVLSYAELMLEVTSQGVFQIAGVDVASFRASLIRIDTNEILAEYTTRAEEAAVIEERWQAGNNGYDQVTDVILRYQDLGQEVALRLFSQAFAAPMHVVPGSRQMAPPPAPGAGGQARRPRPPGSGQ